MVEEPEIRVADIDTTEISEPKGASELALGNRAIGRLIGLINEGPFELDAWPGRDTDQHGRKLRVLVRIGQSLGDILVFEGLAGTKSLLGVPIGLEVDFNLDEERDLDRDLPLVEEVASHLSEYAKRAARCCQEFSEPLNEVSPVDCVSSRG